MVHWIAILGFMTVTAVAGGRLVALWAKTRGLPELLIGIVILGVGTVAVGLGFVIGAVVPDGELRQVLRFVPTLGANVGMAALCLFTWRVYRPSSRAAQLASCGLILGMFGLLLYAVAHGSVQVLATRTTSLVSSTLYVSAMSWSAVEAMIYWVAMRRRLRLGLADPLVTNRFLLWGVATGTAAVGIAIGAIARPTGAVDGGGGSWVTLSYAGHGAIAAVAFWFAFKPPRAYARWIERRATAQSAVATSPPPRG